MQNEFKTAPAAWLAGVHCASVIPKTVAEFILRGINNVLNR